MADGRPAPRLRRMARTRVLIVGGGVAGLEALLALRELASELVDLRLLAPFQDFIHRPMAVAEPFGLGHSSRYDLAGICADQQTEFCLGSLERVRAEERVAETRDGSRLEYDVLLLALGTRPEVALPGSVVVQGPGYTGGFRTVLRKIERHKLKQLAFAVPPAVSWRLPLYELALLTGSRFPDRGEFGVKIRLVTPESAPLEMFGPKASDELLGLMGERGIEFIPDHQPTQVREGWLDVLPARDGPVPADKVVSLPRLRGPAVPGLPQSGDGFTPVDGHGRVTGHSDVFAAGDGTASEIKQGGVAAQQAVAAAEAIAALVGANVEPRPFRPVMRGLLLTGDAPRYMRAEVSGGRGEDWEVSKQPLWWPPGKIAAKHLVPYLAAHPELSRDEPEAGSAATDPVDGVRRLALISGALPNSLVRTER